MKRSGMASPPATGFRCVRREALTLTGVAAALCLLPLGYRSAACHAADRSGGEQFDAWDDAVRWDDRRRMPERR